MSETSKKVNKTLNNNPMETFPGLTIDDLNRYLPALQTTQDIKMDSQHLKEGMFLANCLDGLRKLPNDSVDLIIANPLNKEDGENLDFGNGSTLQNYYQWNQSWVGESRRVLKNSGALYLFSSWQYSGMFQGLLSNFFMYNLELLGVTTLIAIKKSFGGMRLPIFGLLLNPKNFYSNDIP